MKWLKQLLAILLALMTVLSVTACRQDPTVTTTPSINGDNTPGTPTKPDGESGDVDIELTGPWTKRDIQNASVGAFSDAGYYFKGMNGYSILQFLDTQNGIIVPMCSKAGCSHGTANDKNEKCEAAVGMMDFIFYWDGKIYYRKYVREDPYGIHLFRRNADGTGEEEVTVIGKEYTNKKTSLYMRQWLVADGMLYCVVPLFEIESGTEKGSMILLLNLRTGKQEQLVWLENTCIELFAARKDAVLFHTLDLLPFEEMFEEDVEERLRNKPSRLRVWSESGGCSTVFELTYQECPGLVGLLGDKMHYADYEQFYAYDLVTGEHTVSDMPRFTIVSEKYVLDVSGDERVGIYNRFLNVETGQYVSSEFDEAQLSVKNVTDRGCILQIQYLGEWVDPNTVPLEREILAYVSFDAIEDGLQESDLLIIYDEAK